MTKHKINISNTGISENNNKYNKIIVTPNSAIAENTKQRKSERLYKP